MGARLDVIACLASRPLERVRSGKKGIEQHLPACLTACIGKVIDNWACDQESRLQLRLQGINEEGQVSAK